MVVLGALRHPGVHGVWPPRGDDDGNGKSTEHGRSIKGAYVDDAINPGLEGGWWTPIVHGRGDDEMSTRQQLVCEG